MKEIILGYAPYPLFPVMIPYRSGRLRSTNEIIDDEYRITVMFEGVTPLPEYLSDEEKDTIVNLIQVRESVNKISHYAAAIAEITIDQIYKTP